MAEAGWFRGSGGAEGRSGSLTPLKKTGQRSSAGPTQGLNPPGGIAGLHQRTSGKRKEIFRAFSRDSRDSLVLDRLGNRTQRKSLRHIWSSVVARNTLHSLN